MTPEIAVRVEGLGKRYAMPDAGNAAALSGGRFTVALKKRLPSLRNDAERSWFWALQDASFELRSGEVLGIIGRNGAGKSTLLKILAGIVTPSTGRAMLTGRVGSLLEIGTGFHPDLTGRENVMLAAALLGVPRAEVRRRFDDIVEYAGVGGFLDVPVKRYSSGMYMRLAYSVTALLESDILLLDEVLAVGDAEFQKRTKRNVDSIAHGGRTVLFVSHSMASINELCTRCIWLDQGRIVADGSPEEITDLYLQMLIGSGGTAGASDIATAPPRVDVSDHPGYRDVTRETPVIRWVETLRSDGTPARLFETGDAIRIRIGITQGDARVDCLTVAFHTMDDRRITAVSSNGRDGVVTLPADGVVECEVPDVRLVAGDYALILEAGVRVDGVLTVVDSVSDATRIRISLGNYLSYTVLRNQGHIAQRSSWHDDRGVSAAGA